MGRWGQRWTEHTIAQRGKGSAKRPVRRVPRYGALWGQLRSTQTADGWRLCYYGWLPKISGHQVHPFARSKLTKLACIHLGWLPPSMQATGPAQVTILRVLGPRQKPMDDDSIALVTGGVRDALTRCGYIKDDATKWAKFDYDNDASRRQYGPFIEIKIRYLEK